MPYISRSHIPENTIEERAYQAAIAEHAESGNTLAVLPTGMGKTAVALLLAAKRLDSGKILMLAPTKPLVEQHHRYFSQNLLLDEGDVVMITGETKPEKRVQLFTSSRFCVATPEAVKNDLIAERYNLNDVSLLIVDECHHASGNYAYVFIAKRYNETAENPLLLGMTASPGSDSEHVAEICSNLSIQIVESRTEDDPDVRPYVHERELTYVTLELPEELWLAVSVLNSMIEDRISQLRALNYRVPQRTALSMKALNGVLAQIQMRMQQRDSTAYTAVSVHAELMKLRHGVTVAESQGSTALKTYLLRLQNEAAGGGSKASKRIVSDSRFLRILAMTEEWTTEIHPKAAAVVRAVREQLLESPDAKIIVFVSFRDSVQMITDYLNAAGIAAQRFVGQASRDSEKGLSQKQQIETIRKFREGEYPVLVATSVGEEGLDIPATDLVIFYEAVPSEVRSIQRKGRTGRNSSGKILVFITKGTADETYRWVSDAREKKMLKGVSVMKSGVVPTAAQAPQILSEIPAAGSASYGLPEKSGQMTLADAVIEAAREEEEARPHVVIDNREMSSKVAEVLSSLGARITLMHMDAGDYAAGSRIVIERKTVQDFADTLVDRDLFGQMKKLADSALRPVLIIEGGGISDLYGARNIHPNAVRNTLASIAADYDISILFTKDAEETAQMIYAFARRETGEPHPERSKHKAKNARSENDAVLYILTSFPDVGPKAARLLLGRFGSLKGIMSATKEELMSVKGVGEKTASSICAAFEHTWHE
ncbi:MAG: DEAD/DEAH box helicase [Methanocorpusculum sp.]|nr:DEAD/DEAH box helicase [Methanocorpusculum sp.]